MRYLAVKCDYCKKVFRRSQGRINEGEKFNWKIFCSHHCHNQSRIKQQIFKCANSSCNRTFSRTPSDLTKSQFLYCSRSCGITVNNSKFPKRKAIIKICQYCHKQFNGREKYCSFKCKSNSQIISSKEIIHQIQKFYDIHKRIPLKREFLHYKAARSRFGTWNNAVKAAGYEPHPVKFAKKYIANDGHKCDSLAEKIIDDFLSIRNIPHLRSVPYNRDGMTADFKVGNTWIEFLGLHGELAAYDRLVKRKKRLWKERKLNIIPIYPKDLLPESRLNKTLNLLQHH